MPEGPEVRIMVEKTNRIVKNKELNNIQFLSGRYSKHGPPKNVENLLNGLPLIIEKMSCKGKFIWFSFKNSEYVLANTLGMSGFWTKKDLKHNNVLFKFATFNLYFNDVRNFGTLKLINKTELEKKLNSLGPDVLEEYDFEEFYRRLLKKRSDIAIGTALLDQKIISGVGNYLRSDILWYSKISPFTPVSKLSVTQLEIIYNNSILLTRRAYYIEKNIPINSEEFGDLAKIERFFLVYLEDFDIHGNEIEHDQLGGRTIHWCPSYQS